MTYKDIQGLNKYTDLYRNCKTIEKGLSAYQKKFQRGKNDTWLLKSTVNFFYEILSTMVEEFAAKYPTCEVRDDVGRLIAPTVAKLARSGHINKETEKLFNSLCHYGTIGNFKDETEERLDLSDILNVYDKLLAYMPEFLRQFPEPHDHSGKERDWGRIIITAAVVAVGGILLVVAAFARTANNKIDDLEAQLSDAEEQVASVSAENEDIKKEMDDASEKEPEEEAAAEPEEDITEEPEVEAAEEKEEESVEEAAEKTEENSAEEPVEAPAEEGKVEAEEEPEAEAVEDGHHYAVGETWVVDGQWELTIDGISATPYYANDGSDEIVIDYHYKNLGYENSSVGGLIMTLASLMPSSGATVIDSDGIVATPYTIEPDLVYPQTATVGASWSAQAKFHILSPVKSATLEYTQRDESGKEQSAIFDLSW